MSERRPSVEEARGSLRAFSRFVGRPLEQWQSDSLTLAKRITAIVAPRQSGKSRSLAVLALHKATTNANFRVLVVSAGDEAAKRLLADVRRIAVGHPLLKGSVVDEYAGLLTLSNGSEIRCVPASEAQVRGWTVDLLLFDEAALISNDIFSAGQPTTAARPDSRIVLASSATSASGFFYDHVILGRSGSDHVQTYLWALEKAHWISASVIEAARASMTPMRFAAEYQAVFASAADSLLSRHLVERQLVDVRPNDFITVRGPTRQSVGVDWGARNDRTALAAIARVPEAGPRRFLVTCAQRWPAGAPLMGPDGVISAIVRTTAHVAALTAESNGLGDPCCQELFRLWEQHALAGSGTSRGLRLMAAEQFYRQTGPNRESHDPRIGVPELPRFVTAKCSVHTDAPMKAAVYSALRLLLDRGALFIPRDAEDLIRELLLLRVEVTQSGSEKIEASSGHDDLADALAFALRPYRDRDGRWHTLIADLADREAPCPEPGRPVLPVDELPRDPVLQSITGRELNLPPGYGEHAQPLSTTQRLARQARANRKSIQPKETRA